MLDIFILLVKYLIKQILIVFKGQAVQKYTQCVRAKLARNNFIDLFKKGK